MPHDHSRDHSVIARQLAAVRDPLERIRLRLQELRDLGALIMGLNDEISKDVDDLTTAVSSLVDAYTATQKLNADLEAQLNAGPPGLTAEQGAAFASRLTDLQAKIQSALTPVVTALPPAPPSDQTGSAGTGTSGTTGTSSGT